MNVTEISKDTIHYLETDGDDYNFYIRLSSDNWILQMGESYESVFNDEIITKLETAFQKWVVENETK